MNAGYQLQELIETNGTYNTLRDIVLVIRDLAAAYDASDDKNASGQYYRFADKLADCAEYAATLPFETPDSY